MVVLLDRSLNTDNVSQEVLVAWSLIHPVICNETMGLVLALQRRVCQMILVRGSDSQCKNKAWCHVSICRYNRGREVSLERSTENKATLSCLVSLWPFLYSF